MMKQVLLLIFVLEWAGHLGAQIRPGLPEERSIIAAVLADPETAKQPNGGPVEVAPRTALDWLHPWARPNSGRAWITFDDKSATFSIPQDLIDSARIRNRQSLSLMGFELPHGTVLQSTSSALWRLTLSRPGISADGTRAIVAVTFDSPSNQKQSTTISVRGAYGETVYLAKREGTWRVIGRGTGWIT
jgi:hypothetical protein